MKTIYEQFKTCKLSLNYECQTDLNSDVRDDPLIIHKLKVLFHKAYGIDISDKSLMFKRDISSIGQELSVSYKFEYGSADVSTKDQNLEVTFFFIENNLLKIPLGTSRCVVTVDHDLNFKKATYSYYACFSKRILDSDYTDFEHCNLLIQRIVDETNYYNTILYHNTQSKGKEYKDLLQHGLNERYVIPDYAFEMMFKKFIVFACTKPFDFYEAFPEYPSYMDFIHKIDKTVAFMNLFSLQYTADPTLLNQKMLLLDMQVI